MLKREDLEINRVCPKCGYELNSSKNIRCENCLNELSKEVYDDCDCFAEDASTSFSSGSKKYLSAARLLVSSALNKPGLDLYSSLNFNRAKSQIALALLGSSLAIAIIIEATELSSQKETKKASFSEPDRLELKSDSQRVKITKYSDFQSVENVPSGVFTYGGSNCFAALVREGFHQEITATHPNYQLQYRDSEFAGCSANLEPLLDGSLSFAQNARPLTKEDYQLASLLGIRLQSSIVAFDSVIPYVHQANKVKFLTLQQLQDIYLGKITNWQQVGGLNLPIILITLNSERDGDVRLLIENWEVKSNRTIIARDYTNAIAAVSRTEGAIALASAAILKGQGSVQPLALATNEMSPPVAVLRRDGSVNSALDIQAYPLVRSLSIVIRQDNSIGSRAGIAYINFLTSREGREFILKAGFFPVSSE